MFEVLRVNNTGQNVDITFTKDCYFKIGNNSASVLTISELMSISDRMLKSTDTTGNIVNPNNINPVNALIETAGTNWFTLDTIPANGVKQSNTVCKAGSTIRIGSVSSGSATIQVWDI